MPVPTPFHERTRDLCVSHRWKEWAGYYAVCAFDASADREYNAVRQSAGLLDVTPLHKYDVTGPDAGAFLARILVRNVGKMKVGRMTYLCWTDDEGKILDDGTCARLGKEHFRLTSTAPAWWWLAQHAPPYDVAIEDITDRVAALALQGPTSRDILAAATDADMAALKFFGVTQASLGGRAGWISRTGYTGDLGYELWMDNGDALTVWDALVDAGKPWGIEPIGLDALDITRIEAGFILHGTDYISARDALIEEQKSTPFELGLGWTVKLKGRGAFVGQAALEAEQANGSRWALVGLDIDWPALEALYDAVGLPPHLPCGAWRDAVPVYRDGRQVGRATSGTWSPILKKNLALATVEAEYAAPGTVLDIEQTVEWSRMTAPATVVPTPFFDPERKRA